MRTPTFINKLLCNKLLCLLCLLVAAIPGLPSAAHAQGTKPALRATDFLNSIGADSAIDTRGETLAHTIECARYLGLRWFRSGPEGGVQPQDIIELHKQTGARASWGLLSGGSDIANLTATGRELAVAGALLAFEGPNEPNNWGITYKGQTGGKNISWVPVAQLQSDLYKAVKSDAVLQRYPVFGISENGAETDNVGLQFLTIPKGANCVMADGTHYADYANVHNYVYHPNSKGIEDNKTWNAADPGPACKVDGLFGEYGTTWGHHYAGYSAADLVTLPKVTTETGSPIEGPLTEEIHALNLMSLYLDQFKRGWSYTAVYLMRDRSDEGGNQQFGFYKPDYTPRKAALYLHNLTTILADNGTLAKPGQMGYSIANAPATVHDLLLQKSDGTFQLVIWDEKIHGSDSIVVKLGKVPAEIEVYDPTVGTASSQTLNGTGTVPLTLSDHPLILAISARKSK